MVPPWVLPSSGHTAPGEHAAGHTIPAALAASCKTLVKDPGALAPWYMVPLAPFPMTGSAEKDPAPGLVC